MKNFLKLSIAILLFSCSNEEPKTSESKDLSLNFKTVIELEENFFENSMGGMIADPTNKVLYISCREKNSLLSQPEKVYKLNLGNSEIKNIIKDGPDFITKRPIIYNNNLYVYGGQKTNKYDLNLTEISTSVYQNINNPNLVFSRFGLTNNNNVSYIIGGRISGSEVNLGKEIFTHNLVTNTVEELALMPEPRYGSSSETLNNKLYIFNGYETLTQQNSTSPETKLLNSILIYDLSTKTFEKLDAHKNVSYSFSAKYEDKIFVCGNTSQGTFNSQINGGYFGIFDPTTKKLTDIPITIENNSYSFPYICEIEVIGDKIYALVKNSNSKYSIQVANIVN